MSNVMQITPEAMHDTAMMYSIDNYHPLTAMFGRDETENGLGYTVYMVFENLEKRDMDIAKAVFDPKGHLEFDTLTGIVPAAVWFEREIHDMFGIKPINHPDLRPLVLHENFPEDFHPMRKVVPKGYQARGKRYYPMNTAQGEGTFEVPVGPIHAGIIEPGHFRFSQAGEAMLQLDAKLFFTHRGIEKAVEGLNPDEALHMVERICGACSVSNTWSFCQAVERAMGIKVPRRAEIIRTLLSELERIVNHVGDIGNMPAGVGFNPAISLGARLKEQAMRLCEAVAGNRFLRGVIVPGGVRQDISGELMREIRDVMEKVHLGVVDMAIMFEEQDSFQNRVNTTGIVPLEIAINMSMVGVGARASGFGRDSRKDFDYGVYPELKFDVCTCKSGDVAARLQVRLDELAVSFNLVKQLLSLLNECDEKELKVKMEYNKGEGWGISESPRGGDFHYVALDEEGKIDRLFVRSASYANWPAVPFAVGGNIIPDFPLINKSFELCYACIDR